LTCFEQVIVNHQEEFSTSSLRYVIMHLERSLVIDAIQYHSYCVSN